MPTGLYDLVPRVAPYLKVSVRFGGRSTSVTLDEAGYWIAYALLGMRTTRAIMSEAECTCPPGVALSRHVDSEVTRAVREMQVERDRSGR